MSGDWRAGMSGLVTLPSGRTVRGRPIGRTPSDADRPDFSLFLLGRRPPPVPWASEWIRWPDFGLPRDRVSARAVLGLAWRRADRDRVEIACTGGHGRTGTAIACLAVLDGIDPTEAVAWVRRHYDRRAVETPWQSRFVRRFSGPPEPLQESPR